MPKFCWLIWQSCACFVVIGVLESDVLFRHHGCLELLLVLFMGYDQYPYVILLMYGIYEVPMLDESLCVLSVHLNKTDVLLSSKEFKIKFYSNLINWYLDLLKMLKINFSSLLPLSTPFFQPQHYPPPLT